MATILRILIIATAITSGLIFLSGAFAGSSVPQPAETVVAVQAKCDCSHLKVLQIELRNALRLQQAFSSKVTELRTMNAGTSQGALQQFAKGEARRGLEPIPNYKGPSEFDYSPWGENQRTFNFPAAQLCRMSDSATVEFDKAVAASACAGIGEALRAHEKVHEKFCLSSGYQAYLAMHGSDRAQEEVEAYGAQIKILREIISSLGCGFRATGQDGNVVYSGLVCSLERPFTVTGTHPLFIFPFKFTPSTATSGTMHYATSGAGISTEGGGSYTIEGINTDTPRIVVKSQSTASIPSTRTSGGGIATITLVPLENGECQSSQP